MSGPPRVARAILELLGASSADPVAGDLDEEYRRFVRPARGAFRAGLWYWRQVLLSSPLLLARRLKASGSLAMDLRLAIRVLARRPVVAVAAAGTLALALGINTSVFAVVNAILLRPLPYEEPDRLVRPLPDQLFFLDGPQAMKFGERVSTLESVAAWGRSLFLFTDGAQAEEVRGAQVEWDHFDVLGVDATIGRTFVADDADNPDVVVLSHGLWLRRFGADTSVVGTQVTLNGRPHTIIGVLGKDHVPLEFDWEAWHPIPSDPAQTQGSGKVVTGRLRDGVTLEQARQEIARVLAEVWAEDGVTTSPEAIAAMRVVPLADWMLGDQRRPLMVLLGAVVFIALLACANVASLLLAHAGSRMDEFAVRAALGGSRIRVARQVMLEVGVLVAVGALAGLVLARLSLDRLVAKLPPDLPRTGAVEVDGTVVSVTIIAAGMAALLAGLLPALRAGRATGALNAARGSTGGRARVRTRAMLLTGEVALSVTLVIGAGLMLRSLASLHAADPGFDAGAAVTVRPSPPSATYPAGPVLASYYKDVVGALKRLPGVEEVGGIQFLPMTPGGWWDSFRPEGSAESRESYPSVSLRVVLPGYFRALRIPLTAGRLLSDLDAEGGDAVPVLANETFADLAFPGASAVGRLVYLGEDETPLRIVGVVGDVQQTDLRTASAPEMYTHFARVPWQRMHIVARTSGDPRAQLSNVRAAMVSVDPSVAMLGPRVLTDVVGSTFAGTRLLAWLMTVFGAVALLLGAVGVYGVSAQSVSERRREIGIRLALGAAPRSIARRTLISGLQPVLLGLFVGLVAALAASRMMRELVFGVDVTDPWTFFGGPTLLVLVALASLALPTRRASRVDPLAMLRED